MKGLLKNQFVRWCVTVLVFFCLTGHSHAQQHSATNVRVLFAGDSLMESMGPQMQPALTEHLHWSCRPIGKKSTGLCRPDFYNWPVVLEKNLQEFHPHLVVMWVGTNDNQNVRGVKTGGLLTDTWKKAYCLKMQEIIHLCRQYRARLIFIGPPAVGKARVDAELKQINQLMQDYCSQQHIPFLNVRPIFSDKNGSYIQKLRNKNGELVAIRTKDQVHITPAGNNLVMKQLYPLMQKTLNEPEGGRNKSSSRFFRWFRQNAR